MDNPRRSVGTLTPGGRIEHDRAADADAPGARLLEPGNRAQRRRLAAAGRPEQGELLAGPRVESHIAHHGERTVADREPIDLDRGRLGHAAILESRRVTVSTSSMAIPTTTV